MNRVSLSAAVLAASLAFAAPSFAQFVRLGTVDVGFATDMETVYSNFGGPVERLRFSTDRSDVLCRSIRVRYTNGRTDNVFSGALRQDRPVFVDVAGRRIDSIHFTCRSDRFRGTRIFVEAEVGRYMDQWRRSPDWLRLWAGIFAPPPPARPPVGRWTTLGRQSFVGTNDSDSTFVGIAGRRVDRLGLRPDEDARCSRITATFANGSSGNLNTGGPMRRDTITEIRIPGNRALRNLRMRCRADRARRVSIEILARL
jgi:hypothetical protein